MTTNLRALLSQPTDKFEAPKALPDGHYRGVIVSHVFGESKQKKTPFLRLTLSVNEATEDVDNPPDLASPRELRKDYYITPNSLHRLSSMLDAVLGEEMGRSFEERIPEVNGQEVIIQVSTREAEDESGTTYNDVGTVVSASA